MEERPKQSALREWLGLHSDLVSVGPWIGGVMLFILWLIGLLPGLAAALLIGFCAGVSFVGLSIKAFASNHDPIESIGAHMQAAQLPPVLPQAVRTQDRTIEPNIICKELSEFVKFEKDYFHDLQDYDDSALRVVGAIFSNEPDPPRKVGGINKVEAQVIFYNLKEPLVLVEKVTISPLNALVTKPVASGGKNRDHSRLYH